MTTTYRICPRSGLQFDKDAEKLMRFHAVAGVLALLLGGIMALGVILTRWPAVKLLEADVFYMWLTAHGINMLIFWIIFFEMAVLLFASSTLLRCRMATPKLGWVSFWLMAIGAIMTNVAIFSGESSVMFTSYVPMQAKWHFYLGIILFAVGALITCFIFLGTLVVAKAEKTYEGSIPLVTFGALTAEACARMVGTQILGTFGRAIDLRARLDADLEGLFTAWEEGEGALEVGRVRGGGDHRGGGEPSARTRPMTPRTSWSTPATSASHRTSRRTPTADVQPSTAGPPGTEATRPASRNDPGSRNPSAG